MSRYNTLLRFGNDDFLFYLAYLGFTHPDAIKSSKSVRQGIATRAQLKKNMLEMLDQNADVRFQALPLVLRGRMRNQVRKEKLCDTLQSQFQLAELIALYSYVSDEPITEQFVEQMAMLSKKDLCSRLQKLIERTNVDVDNQPEAVSTKTLTSEQQLVDAIKAGDFEKIVDLISNDVSPNSPAFYTDEKGVTTRVYPLLVAIQKNDPGMVAFLIKSGGAGLMVKDAYGSIIMHAYARGLSKEMDSILRKSVPKGGEKVFEQESDLGRLIYLLTNAEDVSNETKYEHIIEFIEKYPQFNRERSVIKGFSLNDLIMRDHSVASFKSEPLSPQSRRVFKSKYQ